MMSISPLFGQSCPSVQYAGQTVHCRKIGISQHGGFDDGFYTHAKGYMQKIHDHQISSVECKLAEQPDASPYVAIGDVVVLDPTCI